MIRPVEYVAGIQPYVPGKPVEELERELGITGSVKLASNENPLGPSPVAVAAALAAIQGIHRYPDGSGYYLKKALAEKHSLAEEELILGNGSNELIDIAVRTFLRAGDEAVMAAPSFVVYSMAVRSVGARPIEVPLKDHVHDLESMADAVTSATKMLFIANPNNPTGTINRWPEFDRMMARLPDDLLVVVDEAYFEYVVDAAYAQSLKHLTTGKSILILRTFSKIYGLAGLRIGYGIGLKELIEAMNRVREPFNTNVVAQSAALAALSDTAHLLRSRETNEEGRRFLSDELSGLGVAVVPSEANFLYLPLGRDAKHLYEQLLKKGVIVRPVGPHELRVTVGLPKENRRFIEAFRSVL